MIPNQFLTEFRRLHGLARKGALPADQRREYDEGCSMLSFMMLAAQQMSTDQGTARGALRMAQMRKVEIEAPGRPREKSSTIDLGEAGLATMLSAAIPIGEMVTFALHLPLQLVSGKAKIVSCKAQARAFRVSCEFRDLPAVAREALRTVIIDAVLQRLDQQIGK
jgi:hypothetical protein